MPSFLPSHAISAVQLMIRLITHFTEGTHNLDATLV